MTVICIYDATRISEFKQGQELVVPDPKELHSFKGFEDSPSSTEPKTRIIVAKISRLNNKNSYHFRVKQESETILDTIRIFDLGSLEYGYYDKGWQRVESFDCEYDPTDEELIVYHDQESARLFVKRFNKYLEAKSKKFDLNKFCSRTDYRIWGIWSEGRELHIAKEARFGHHLNDLDLASLPAITALNIVVKIGKKETSITLSSKGIVSAQSGISVKQLLEFYRNEKNNLL